MLLKRQKFSLFFAVAVHTLVFNGMLMGSAIEHEFSRFEVLNSEKYPSIDCDLPTISVQPTNQQICSGTTLTLTVVALNAISYQWKKNNIIIPGATSSSYSKTNVQLLDSGIYIVDIINTCGTVSSNSVNVSINAAPILTAISYPQANYCNSSGIAAVTINGSNVSGGTFSVTPFGLALNPANGLITPATSTSNIYTVTYTKAASGGCSAVSTSTAVTINSNPVIGISPSSATICNGYSVTLIASGAISYNWSPAIGLSSTSGNSVIANPTSNQSYNVVGTNNAGCTGSASLTINVTPSPILNGISYPLGNYCISSGNIIASIMGSNVSGGLFSASPTGLSINSSTGVINTLTSNVGTYTITYTKAAFGGCNQVSATTQITINPNPILTINPSSSFICSGDSVQLIASGAITYSWTPATGLNITNGAIVKASPNTTQLYFVYGTTSSGCTGSASVQITVTPQPIITSLSYPGSPFCTSIQPVPVQLSGSNLSGGIFTSSPLGLNLNSATGLMTPSLSQEGIYTVMFVKSASGGCSSVSGSTTVEILQTPTVTVNPTSASICSNSSTILTASGASSYTWTPSLGLNTITGANVIASPSSTIEYTVTGIAATGCANESTIIVNVNSVIPLNITASANTNFTCPGTPFNLFTTSLSDTLLNSNFNGSSQGWTTINSSTNGNVPSSAWTLRPSGYVYTTTSSSNITFNSNDNSSFYLSNSDAQGLIGNTNTILRSPPFSTIGYETLQLMFYHFYRYSTGTVDRARVEVSLDNVNWTTATTFSSTIGASNSFTLSTVDLSSYIGQPNVYVRFRYTGNFAWYWAIDNITITGTLLGGENTYAWTSTPAGFYSSDKNPTFVSAQENTTYTVIATNQLGCTTASNVFMEVQNIDPILTVSDTTLCSPNSFEIGVLDTGMYTAGYPLGSTVLWLGYAISGPTNTTINSNLGSTFQAEVTLPNGCIGLSNIINVNTRSITVNSAITDANCNLNNGKIRVTISTSPVSPYRYQWKLGNVVLKDTVSYSLSDSIININPGLYTLNIYDNYGNELSCETSGLSFNVNSIILPQVNLSAQPTTCFNANDGSINATIIGGQPPYSYLWSNGSVQTSISNLSAGLYTLTVTDKNGCSVQSSITVSQPQQILINPTLKNTCLGVNKGSIKVNVTNINSPFTITWYDSNFTFISNGDSIGNLQEGDYNVFVQEDNGFNCSLFQQFHVGVNPSSINSISLFICDSIIINGIKYKQSGVYNQVLVNQFGCDSILTINLNIKQSSSSITLITSCDSLGWNDSTYYTSGTYQKQFINSVGCDSVAVLNLTINNSTNSISSITACDSLIWNDSTYYTSGTYQKQFINSVGCDSVAVLNLTINNSTNSISSITACDSLIWNDSTYYTSGTYQKQFINSVGCDSVAFLNLTINQSTNSVTSITSCDSAVWNGVSYYSSGIYTQHFTNSAGCDSVAMLDLTINTSSVFYYDLDGDNFGYGAAIFACEQPIQTSTNNQDCNDTNSFINPLSSEICENNIDDNCNNVIDENCTFTINIKLFIQGLYSNGTMVPVLFTTGLSIDSTDVDSVLVELHDQNLPYNKEAEATGILKMDGTLAVNFSSIFQNHAFYIVIRHRNSIQTWSKTPIYLVPFITFEFN